MPTHYQFKDSKIADSVGKGLMFISKFSKKQAMIKFTDSSIIMIWSISPKTVYFHSEISAPDMFKNRQKLKPFGLGGTIVVADPSNLGRMMKGANTEKTVTISIIRPDKIKVFLGSDDSSKRIIVHTLPCHLATEDDFRSMLMLEMENSNNLKYDVKCYITNISRLRHIIDSFLRLQSQRFHIWAKRTENGNELSLQSRTQSSVIKVNISDLEDGFLEGDNDKETTRDYNEAGVSIETKKMSLFLSSLLAKEKSKLCFSIRHNNCLKISLINELIAGERSYQAMLIPHGLGN